MPTITVPEETYQRLSRRAAALKTTVEALAGPALEQAAGEPPAGEPVPPSDLLFPEWKKLFDEHMAVVAARAERYPPGHVTDVSRESMYEGVGE